MADIGNRLVVEALKRSTSLIGLLIDPNFSPHRNYLSVSV
jgi:hypothetical protein